jgi:hypothetical protein
VQHGRSTVLCSSVSTLEGGRFLPGVRSLLPGLYGIANSLAMLGPCKTTQHSGCKPGGLLGNCDLRCCRHLHTECCGLLGPMHAFGLPALAYTHMWNIYMGAHVHGKNWVGRGRVCMSVGVVPVKPAVAITARIWRAASLAQSVTALQFLDVTVLRISQRWHTRSRLGHLADQLTVSCVFHALHVLPQPGHVVDSNYYKPKITNTH